MINTEKKNKELNLKESLANKVFLESRPVRISLNMSGKCNIRCIYCHLTYADYFSKNELSPQEFEKMNWALEKLSHLSFFSSTEPLSAIHFKEIFRLSDKFNTEKYLSTNGILINNELAELFVKYKLHFLTISFGGLTKKSFMYAHKVNKFLDVLKKIKTINNYKHQYNSIYPKLRLVLVVMKSNAHELPLAVKYAKKYKFSEGIKITYLKAYTENMLSELPFNCKEYVQHYVRQAQKLGKSLGIPVEFDGDNFDDTGNDDSFDHKKCLEPWQRMHIESNGDVHVCPSPRNKAVAGNINTDKINDIWNSDVYRTFRSKVNSTNPPEVCRRCTHNFHKNFSRYETWNQTDIDLGVYKRKKKSAIEKLLKNYQKK